MQRRLSILRPIDTLRTRVQPTRNKTQLVKNQFGNHTSVDHHTRLVSAQFSTSSTTDDALTSPLDQRGVIQFGLANASAVHRGTAFELLAIASLQRLIPRCTLHHAGQSADQNIDFYGHINPPQLKQSAVRESLSRPVTVIGQCKHYSSPLGSAHVRHLEGTLQQHRTMQRKQGQSNASNQASPHAFEQDEDQIANSIPVLGLLVNSSSYSIECLRHTQRSTQPIALVTIQYNDEAPHQQSHQINAVTRLTLNQAARDLLPWLHIAIQRSTNNQSPNESRIVVHTIH